MLPAVWPGVWIARSTCLPNATVSPSISCFCAGLISQPDGAAVCAPVCMARWPAEVMWSAWAWVSMTQARCAPVSLTSARSRSSWWSTGSISSASFVSASISRYVKVDEASSKSWWKVCMAGPLVLQSGNAAMIRRKRCTMYVAAFSTPRYSPPARRAPFPCTSSSCRRRSRAWS
ncbi:hypothetical protein D9M68_758430 [compost metagenome]